MSDDVGDDDDDDIELLPIIQLQLWFLYHTYSSY